MAARCEIDTVLVSAVISLLLIATSTSGAMGDPVAENEASKFVPGAAAGVTTAGDEAAAVATSTTVTTNTHYHSSGYYPGGGWQNPRRPPQKPRSPAGRPGYKPYRPGRGIKAPPPPPPAGGLGGTHDSLTFDLSTNVNSDSCSAFAGLAAGTVRQWAVAQTQSVASQLNLGVRYMDIRPVLLSSGSIYVQHCVLTNSPLSKYMQQVAAWLTAAQSAGNTKEILILHFKDFNGQWGSSSYSQLFQLMGTTFGGFIVPPNTITGASTLAQVLQATANKGPAVCVVMDPDDDSAFSLPSAQYVIKYGDLLWRKWANTNNVPDLIKASNGYIAKRPPGKVMVLEGVITEDGTDAISNTVFVGSSSTRSMLLYWEQGELNTTPLLLQYMSANWLKPSAPTQPMIIMLDNPHVNDAVFIVNANTATPPAYTAFNYGHCSASYSYWSLSCSTSNDKCGSGYSDKNIVKAEFVQALEGLLAANSSYSGKFDYILVETTGLANPGPIMAELWTDEELEAAVVLDGVVTVVDGRNIIRQLSETRPPSTANEAQLQVALADIILLNKAGAVAGDDVYVLKA
eukprot:gene11178-11328_t